MFDYFLIDYYTLLNKALFNALYYLIIYNLIVDCKQNNHVHKDSFNNNGNNSDKMKINYKQ